MGNTLTQFLFDTLLSLLRKVKRAAIKYQQFILRIVAYIQLLKWNCFWAVLTVFIMMKTWKKKPFVFVLDVAHGGETAPTAGGNCSYSTVTAVIISSCSVSGSFHHQAGCIYIGHDWIKYLKGYIHAIYNSALAVIGSAAGDTHKSFSWVKVGVLCLVKYALDILENVDELCSLSLFIIQ